mmetsp:Transcript_36010/g.88020  ORF Transcript_36010/g.88020 Transcript_36010/m.88020 type:complete len:89 (+) Transcript_36010:57-323(+)
MTASYLLYKRHQPLSNMQAYMAVTQQRAVVDLEVFDSLFFLLDSLNDHFEEIDSRADEQRAAHPTSDTGGEPGDTRGAATSAASCGAK